MDLQHTHNTQNGRAVLQNCNVTEGVCAVPHLNYSFTHRINDTIMSSYVQKLDVCTGHTIAKMDKSTKCWSPFPFEKFDCMTSFVPLMVLICRYKIPLFSILIRTNVSAYSLNTYDIGPITLHNFK